MIAKSLTLDVSVETAFRAFTDHIGRWWPPDHVPGGGKLLDVRFSRPEVGADLLMETQEAGIFPIGRVLTWSPPSALSYDFFLGSGPEAPSVVDVRFTRTTAGTRVDIGHRRGRVPVARWEGAVVGYRHAWQGLLPAFQRFTQEAP